MNRLYQLSILILSLLLFSNLISAVSIGISPGRVNFEKMLAGGYAERIVTVSTNSDQDLVVSFDVKGDIKDWISFEPNTTEIVISRTSPYKLNIIAEPPSDLIEGTYSGSISFVTQRFGDLSGRAGGLVRAAVTQTINIEITNEQISICKAGGFTFSDIEEGFPLDFWFTVENDGNVRVRPLVSVDIWDQLQENLILSREIATEEILPTLQKRIYRTLPNDLDIGQYWVRVSVGECSASDILTFSVVEKGAIVDKGTLNQIRNKVWAYVNEPIEIAAEFYNTGPRKVYARFKGVIKLDNDIVKVIETEELEALPGEKTDLTFFFTPDKPGRYVISGRVLYNQKLTFEKSSILNVNPIEPIPEESFLAKALPLIIYILIVITIIFLVRKILKEKKRRRPF